MKQEKLTAYAALLLRLGLGALFIAHGMLKITVFTIPGTVGYFGSLGLPGELAYITIAVELIGGVALFLGAYVREVSIGLIPILLGSIAFAHLDAGWVFSNEGGGWEYPAFWALALVVQALLGPGAMAASTKTMLPVNPKHPVMA